MREEFFTQSEWQGINFEDLEVALDPLKPAGSDFYSEFYDELSRRYISLNDLPDFWQTVKRDTADAIAKLVNKHDQIMSYGAGIGYVEQALVKEHGLNRVFVCDVAPAATHFDPDRILNHIETPDITPDSQGWEQRFDVVIMIQVLYALDRTNAIKVLINLKQSLVPGGQLIMFNTSPTLSENGGLDTHLIHGKLRVILGYVTHVRNKARRLAPKSKLQEQGWGWARDNDAVRGILNEAGFASPKFFSMAGQSVCVAVI